jgi:hypothetical protein
LIHQTIHPSINPLIHQTIHSSIKVFIASETIHPGRNLIRKLFRWWLHPTRAFCISAGNNSKMTEERICNMTASLEPLDV